MEFFCVLLTVHVVGWLIAIMVIRTRAGVGVWHRLKVFGEGGYGPGWAMSAGLAAFFWPITLLVWLAWGRPEPRRVFNEKAQERRRRHSDHDRATS